MCRPSPLSLISPFARATTDSGVTDMTRVLPALRAMAELGVLLLLHGEVTDPAVDMFDREAVFIETKLVRGVMCVESVTVSACYTVYYFLTITQCIMS